MRHGHVDQERRVSLCLHPGEGIVDGMIYAVDSSQLCKRKKENMRNSIYLYIYTSINMHISICIYL